MNTLSEPGLPEQSKRPNLESLPSVGYTYFKDLRIFRIGIFLFFLATAAFAQEEPAPAPAAAPAVNPFEIPEPVKPVEPVASASSATTPVTEPAEVIETTAPEVAPAPVEVPAASTSSTTTAPSQLPVVDEKCDTKYNKNELLYNVREGFLLGFKNCANELVKETALARSPLAKKPAPEPGSFITQCVMGNIKEKVDGVPGGEKITNVVENFLQTLLKAALSGGDPKALVNAAANLDINGMMETISSFAKGSSCFVDEPFTPPAGGSGGDDSEDEGKRRKRSVTYSFYRLNYVVHDNRYYRIERSGLTGTLGFELELFAEYLFFGIFAGGGMLGDGAEETTFGFNVKKLFWLSDGNLALPISLNFASRNWSGGGIYSGALSIIPSVDLQYFLVKHFSFYGGYMYSINVDEDGDSLGNERMFGVIPGALRFGFNFHFGDYL